MVEAKLRVETVEYRDNNNPFYGNSLVKKVTEESFCHDKDTRKYIAPSGVKAILKVGDVIMDIIINRYYLEHEATDDGLSRYLASLASMIRFMRFVCGSIRMEASKTYHFQNG